MENDGNSNDKNYQKRKERKEKYLSLFPTNWSDPSPQPITLQGATHQRSKKPTKKKKL